MNGVNAIEQAQFHDRAKEIIDLAVTAAENPMADEAGFCQCHGSSERSSLGIVV